MKIEKPDSLDAVEEIFSCAPCGIGFFVVDSQKPLYLNDAYYKLVGYTPQEYKDQIGTEYQKLFFAEDIDITNKIDQFFDSTKSAAAFEYRIKRKDGSKIWARLTVSYIVLSNQKCVLCFCEDISNEKENYTHLIQVAESIGSSIYVMRIKDRKEYLLYANSTFYDLIVFLKICICRIWRSLISCLYHLQIS